MHILQKALLASLIVLLNGRFSMSGEIILPSNSLERDAPVTLYYRTGARATGKGSLLVKWTDAYGRIVEDRRIPFELADESDVGFTLDMRRAAAMKNQLQAHFSCEGVDQK